MRIDAASQRPAVRQELTSMAKSLSTLSVTMANWGKLIKAHPDRDPYPLLRKDFQFAEGFGKTLDELLAESSNEQLDEIDQRVKAALSPATRRKLHDLREVYAQAMAQIAASTSNQK
jgi:hypothetical protein